MVEFASKLQGFGKLWGFDSFIGFPDETTGVHLPTSRWKAGGDSASDALGLERNFSAIYSFIKGNMEKAGGAAAMRARRTYFVPGYYNESLTEELYSTGGFQPALLVDLDCDLYISTIQALEWLFKHRILRVESVVRYDDWPHPRSAASSSGIAIANAACP